MSAQIKECGFCGNEFMAEKMTIKYCSRACKQKKKKEQERETKKIRLRGNHVFKEK